MTQQNPTTINLRDIADDRADIARSVDEIGALADIDTRKYFVRSLFWLFVCLNTATILLVACLAWADYELVDHLKRKADVTFDPRNLRVVTSELLMSMVAATVVQVGSAMFVITRYLFPKSASEND